jgi:hypothetical protein
VTIPLAIVAPWSQDVRRVVLWVRAKGNDVCSTRHQNQKRDAIAKVFGVGSQRAANLPRLKEAATTG